MSIGLKIVGKRRAFTSMTNFSMGCVVTFYGTSANQKFCQPKVEADLIEDLIED
jgi:hypothetical protein